MYIIICRILLYVCIYLLIGFTVTVWSVKFIGEKADKYDDSTLACVIVLWPVIVAVVVMGILVGILKEISKK